MKSSAVRAADRVGCWTEFYTRRLPLEIADARRVEIASDLHEQLSYFAHRGVSDRVIARAVSSRALRGAVADVIWRREQLRAARLASHGGQVSPWLPTSLLALCCALGVGELLAVVFVFIRWAVRVSQAPYIDGSSQLYLVVAGTAVSACGLWLLRRERSRWVGALWLAASVCLIVDRGFSILVPVSTTARFVQDLVPGWSAIEWLAISGIMLFFVGAAIWWAPTSRSSKALAGGA